MLHQEASQKRSRSIRTPPRSSFFSSKVFEEALALNCLTRMCQVPPRIFIQTSPIVRGRVPHRPEPKTQVLQVQVHFSNCFYIPHERYYFWTVNRRRAVSLQGTPLSLCSPSTELASQLSWRLQYHRNLQCGIKRTIISHTLMHKSLISLTQ